MVNSVQENLDKITQLLESRQLDESKSIAEILAGSALDGTGTLTQQIYRMLRNLVVEMKLMPNRFLSEKDVAAALNVSKTPVREAFIRLAEDGVVNIVPKSGTYVSPIDIQRAYEGYFIRSSLESSCAAHLAGQATDADIAVLMQELAAQRQSLDIEDYRAFYLLDNKFHETIFLAAGLPNTKRFVDNVKFEVDRIRSFKLVMKIRRVEEVLADHTAIVNAIAARDAETARLAAMHHFAGMSENIEQFAKNESFLTMFNLISKNGRAVRRLR